MKAHLRKYRFLNGELSQQQVADSIKISRQTIIAIENGNYNPSIKLALLLAKKLNVSVEQLFELEKKIMHKWDSISWFATGIFILSLLLAYIFHNDLFLFLMAGSYMLRPTLYALGLFTKTADERQMLIQYRSGNIALTILIIVIIIFAVKANMEGKPADDFNLLVITAIAARALSGILMMGNYKKTGVIIALSVGALWLLFVILSHGISLGMLAEAAPGLVILLTGFIGIKKPLISSAVFIIVTVLAFYFIAFKTGNGFTIYQLTTAVLVCIPLSMAAFCFYKSSKVSPENIGEISRE